MILYMKITIIYQIENFLLIIFCTKSKVSNKKVLDDSWHMMHKIKKVLYSINIDLQQGWWIYLVLELISFKELFQSQSYQFYYKKVWKIFISVAWVTISYVRSSAKGVLRPSGYMATYSKVTKLSHDEKFHTISFCNIFHKNP